MYKLKERKKGYESNYVAKFVTLRGVKKMENSNFLQTVSIDFNNVITGLDAKDGMHYVYFCPECKISKEFLAFTNSFRDSSLNADKEKKGFFEDNCRVKATRLRGMMSMGYIVPVQTLFDFVGKEFKYKIGDEFEILNGEEFVSKYQSKKSKMQGAGKSKSTNGQTPKVSRIIPNHINLHVSTAQLKKNLHAFMPDDIISLTYKTHGTSWWTSNAKVKRRLTWFEKLLVWLGVPVETTEYDIVYGSRKVIKNKTYGDPKNQEHYYSYDIWKDISDKFKDDLPKGFTLYGEAIGFEKTGKAIQQEYDYGCGPLEYKTEIYRITQTNVDGFVTELSYPEIKQFCENIGATPSHLFYYGKLKDLYKDIDYTDRDWQSIFIENLVRDYNEKDCFMCANKVPEEGIVIRRDNLLSCDSYKLKSERFFERETKMLDKGVPDMEEDQGEESEED